MICSKCGKECELSTITHDCIAVSSCCHAKIIDIDETTTKITKISKEQARYMVRSIVDEDCDVIIEQWEKKGYIERSELEIVKEEYNRFMELNQMNQDLKVIVKYVTLLEEA